LPIFIYLQYCIVLNVGCSSFSDSKKNTKNYIPSIDSIIDVASKKGTGYTVNSLYFLDSSLAGKKLNFQEKIKLFTYRSYIYNYYVVNYDSAEIYADSMLFLLKNKDVDKYTEEFTNAYFTKGDVFYLQKNYSESYAYYYKARQLGIKYVNYCTRKEYNHRIAVILYNQFKFEEAKNFFIEAFNNATICELNDFQSYVRQQGLLNNIGLSYLKLNKLDSAEFYFNKAIQFVNNHQNSYTERKNFHEIALGVIYGNLGDVYKLTNRAAEAKNLYKKSVSINLKKGHEINDAHLSFLKLSNLYFEELKLDSMLFTLQKIRKSLDTVNFARADVEWHKQMWQYYNAKQNIAKAYEYLNLYIQKKEDYTKEHKSINEIDINKQFDALNKQSELEKLERNNHVNELYLIVVSIIVFTVILIAILLWYNWNKSKQNVQQLKILNSTIHAQNIQLEEALNKLEINSREKDKIVKLVAHDLRTPVASISSLAELIIDDKNEESRLEMLHVIKAACNNSLSLISEIFATAGIKSKTSYKAKYSVNSFINNCVSLLQVSVQEKGLQFNVKTLSNDVLLLMDIEKMNRVIYNLVNNAVKFSHSGGTIFLEIVQHENQITFIVKDEGIGIPKNMQYQLFNTDTDNKRAGTSGEESFGLGLSICKQIVEAHEGNIRFESEENKGTTFYVALPLNA
jgi:two-component system, OmpR family, sensor histidine kinase VicK